jgi:hypothetical protein
MTTVKAPDPVSADFGGFVTTRWIAERFCVMPETILYWYRHKPGFPQPCRPGKRKLLWRRQEVLDFESKLSEVPANAS